MEVIEQINPILGRKFVTFQNKRHLFFPLFYHKIEEENGQLKLKLHPLEQQSDL